MTDGCCSACGGKGGTPWDGPCWECLGSGHSHAPEFIPECLAELALHSDLVKKAILGDLTKFDPQGFPNVSADTKIVAAPSPFSDEARENAEKILRFLLDGDEPE